MRLIIWDAEKATFDKEVEVGYMETLQNVVEQIIPPQDWFYFVPLGKNGKFVKGNCWARSFTQVSVGLEKENLAKVGIEQFSFDQVPEKLKATYDLLRLCGNICFSCNIRETPQWRRAWGSELLCNACSLRLGKSSICTRCFFVMYKNGWCRCHLKKSN